jgi:hypothetical protein
MKLLNVATAVALAGLLAAPAVHAQEMAKKGGKAKPASEMMQAKTHLKEAIKEGKAGKADGLVTHAKIAQEHLTAADKEKSTEHTQAAMKSLQEAIDKGTGGNAADATKAAETAMEHLNMGGGGMGKKGGMKKAG